jgi:hypothetical protein
MSIKSALKSFFKTGDIPTESQYADLIDSNLNTDDTADQSVESNLLGKKQITVQGKVLTFTATPTFSFSTGGNNQEMPVEGNITTFTTTEEKNAGNYDIWLLNDGTAGRTVAAPTGWVLIPGGDTHDTAANAINLYQFKVSPNGTKRYIIKNM